MSIWRVLVGPSTAQVKLWKSLDRADETLIRSYVGRLLRGNLSEEECVQKILETAKRYGRDDKWA